MPTFIMLSTLGPDGAATLRDNPERIRAVTAEVEAMGVKVVAQYALLGDYDFLNIIEAPDHETMLRLAVAARGPRHVEDAAPCRRSRSTSSSPPSAVTASAVSVPPHALAALLLPYVIVAELGGQHDPVGQPLDAVTAIGVLGHLEAPCPRLVEAAAHLDSRPRIHGSSDDHRLIVSAGATPIKRG